MNCHQIIDLYSFLIPYNLGKFLWYKKVVWIRIFKLLPLDTFQIAFVKRFKFIFSFTVQICVIHFAQAFLFSHFANKYVYRYTLLNIKDIFIFPPVRGRLFLFRISMKIKNVDVIKSFKQMFSHLTMNISVKK